MNGKKILVLGASSDIGIKLIKEILKKTEIEIYAHYSSNSSELKKIKHENLKIFKADFLKINEKNFNANFKKLLKLKFDYFVNLVGYVKKSNFSNFTLKDVNQTFNINVFIPNLILSNIIKNMLKNKFGRILNCSSIGIKFGGSTQTYTYSFSKYAIEFIPTNFKEWAKKNVLINNLRIGVTDTKIHKKIGKDLNQRVKMIPINRAAKKIEIVKYILFLISEENSYTTGQTISISGGE